MMINLCENGIFAGLNSYGGYVPLLRKCVSGMKTVYIIKGTSGCGKSTLLKRLYMRGMRLGKIAIPIRCSADNDSFDGVIFPELGIALVDGTAPHVLEPELPLINDTTVDITADYDNVFAEKYAKTVKKLMDSKKQCYCNAYAMLRSAGEMESIIEKYIGAVADESKLEKFANEFVKTNAKAEGNICKIPCACFNGSGFTFSGIAHGVDIITVTDTFGISEALINTICSICERNGKKAGYIYSPVDESKACGVFFESIALISNRYFKVPCKKSIYGSRFINKEKLIRLKQELSSIDKLRADLLQRASHYMKKALDIHFEIEKIYSLAADFEKADNAYIMLEKKIFRS